MSTRSTHTTAGHATPHRRDAAATRAAILEAARRQFARAGYDHVGVREIAADAGVTAALVNRYFGSKDQLFAEVLAGGFDIARLLPAGNDRARFGRTVAEYVAAPVRTRASGDSLAILLRSATNPTAADLLRTRVDEQLVRPLADWIGGDDAVQRAALVVACLMGVGILRRVLRSRSLAATDERTLADLLAPVLQACIEGRGVRVEGEVRVKGNGTPGRPDVPFPDH